jgi:hypothetical protein
MSAAAAVIARRTVNRPMMLIINPNGVGLSTISMVDPIDGPVSNLATATEHRT